MTVTLENVTRSVDGIPTIRDVSLTLERGTLSVLLGPTLSGKTSTMRLLAGLDRPGTGKVKVDGKDVTGFDVRKRSVAMVYQQFINYPSLTVYENIASPLRVQGKPRLEIDKRVQEAARLLRLEPYLSRTPLQLSGGQQQRTAIARAGQGRRSGAARRAARQSRLQAARGVAHRTAAHFRGLRRDLRLCDH
jgi:glycerol transport system ATP-binding protein